MIARKSTVVVVSVLLTSYFLIRCYQTYGWSNLSRVIEINMDAKESETYCETGKPCVYNDKVDIRIIVITYNRSVSLKKLLRTVNELELDGDSGSLEIWIDVNKQGELHNKTVEVAKSFKWKRGPVRVHIQTSHAGIYGQWIDTWRPQHPNSKEQALILEDDLSISKYAYRWTKAVNKFFGSNPEFAGSTLTSDQQKSHDGASRDLFAPQNETIFMYKCIGSWGFSPKTSLWADFQDWYHEHINKEGFHPYVPDSITTEWYKLSEMDEKADIMWTQWFIYYAYQKKLFTVYSNLKSFNRDNKSCLCINRRELGLHYHSKGKEDYCSLLDRWEDKFVSFTDKITKLNWNGKIIDKY